VLDHYGRVMTDPALAAAVQSRLERLPATSEFWLKLLAPYLACVNANGFGSLQQFVERLLAVTAITSCGARIGLM